MSKPPKARPCGSCPYRKDVPSGVWHESEYLKLIAYDRPTADQPTRLFDCHQQDGHLCAGWVGCHDMDNALAIRVHSALGEWTPEELDQILDYVTVVDLWGSGLEAAQHGFKEILSPGEKALKTMDKLKRKGLVDGTGTRELRPSDG